MLPFSNPPARRGHSSLLNQNATFTDHARLNLAQDALSTDLPQSRSVRIVLWPMACTGVKGWTFSMSVHCEVIEVRNSADAVGLACLRTGRTPETCRRPDSPESGIPKEFQRSRRRAPKKGGRVPD